MLPVGLSLVSATPTPGTSYSSVSGTWNVGALNNGASVTLTLRALVNVPGARTNTATISASGTQDPNPANNTASATETPMQADVSVTKTVDVARPNVGDTITFTVTAANADPNAATNVQLTDLLPTGLAFISSTPSGSYNSATGVWTVGTINNGGSGDATNHGAR